MPADELGAWLRRSAQTLGGPLAEITAYLTGRASKLTTAGGEPAPVLGPWL